MRMLALDFKKVLIDKNFFIAHVSDNVSIDGIVSIADVILIINIRTLTTKLVIVSFTDKNTSYEIFFLSSYTWSDNTISIYLPG